MVELGVNSVLFGNSDFATACRYIAAAGYDGVEVSAIKGMCEHLDLDRWQEQAADLRRAAADAGLQLLSMEEAALDEDRLLKAFQAGGEIGIPVVNIGPGGKSGSREDFDRQTDLMAAMAEEAARYGVTLCVKAHVGACIDTTPTTLAAMEKVDSPAFEPSGDVVLEVHVAYSYGSVFEGADVESSLSVSQPLVPDVGDIVFPAPDLLVELENSFSVFCVGGPHHEVTHFHLHPDSRVRRAVCQ